MADRSKRSKRSAPSRGERPGYEVGYGKPPKDTRFRPGQSGNPRGRPKGARNRTSNIPTLSEERMKTVVMEEAYRTIGIRDGEQLVEIPVIQAVIRSVALNAAKGNQRAQRMFTDLLQTIESENRALYDEYLETFIEYKVEWEREIKRCEKLGTDVPDPLPHPDDIVINMKTGRVEMHGPMTREEKVDWDHARENKVEHDEFIEELEAMIEKRPRDRRLRRMLARHRKINARLAEAVGPYAARLDEAERQRKAGPAAAEPASDPRVVPFSGTKK